MPASKTKILTLVESLGSEGAETLAARIAIGLDPTWFERLSCATHLARTQLASPVRHGPARLCLRAVSAE